MAVAFIAVDGAHGVNAERYYRMFPSETVLEEPHVISLRSIQRMRGPTLESLLRAVAGTRDSDVLIVSHGSPTQLMLRVMQGVNLGVDRNFIDLILGDTGDGELADRLRTNAGRVRALRRRIRQVQGRSIRRLEFRACRVGRDRATLTALKRLFRAQSACAPRVVDAYGSISDIRPTREARVLAAWQRTHPDHRVFGDPPDRFFWVNRGSTDPPVISAAFAESAEAARAWARAKFKVGEVDRYRPGVLPYHFQTAMDPDSSDRRGERVFSNDFVFPSDEGYRRNLVRIT